MTHSRDQWWAVLNTAMNRQSSVKCRWILDNQSDEMSAYTHVALICIHNVRSMVRVSSFVLFMYYDIENEEINEVGGTYTECSKF